MDAGKESADLFFEENDPDFEVNGKQTAVRSFTDDENERSLNTWERNVAVTQLEECLEQIAAILQRTNLKRNDINLSFVPNDVRYLNLIKSRLLFTSEERAMKDMETDAVLRKLQNDSTFAINILEKTVRELRSSGTFSILSKIPNNLTEERDKKSSVLYKARKNIEALKSLREIFAKERNANELETKEFAERLASTLREIDTQGRKGKASIAYVFAWEKARCEQNVARCKIAEDDLRRTLAKLEIEEKNEKRITKDVEAFLCHNIAKNEELIVHWENRYDREWAEYKSEIGRLEKQINMEKIALKKLEEEQRVKQDFIDVYLAEKEADRKKKEHEEHVRKSTIKIQAWWRGVMVRRKLGPYRPEEKKKKRPNKSKK